MDTNVVANEASSCWIRGSEAPWTLVPVVGKSQDSKTLFVQLPGQADPVEVDAAEAHPFDPSHALNLEDASMLNNLHEAPMLNLFYRRFKASEIYTYTGQLLISINPYKKIPGLYDNPWKAVEELQESSDSDTDDEFREDAHKPLDWTRRPHIFSIAQRAYNQLCQGRNQSIVITGESGAGKTEACKYVMRHLVSLNQRFKVEGIGDQIESGLLHSNVVLEAFGNARTCRNDNSSRFGKYVRLLYSTAPTESACDLDQLQEPNDSIRGVLLGARTDTFMLEKSRIISIEPGERNYHVFYQLCKGAAFSFVNLEEVPLDSCDTYMMLNSRNTDTNTECHNDRANFAKLSSALKVLGIMEVEQNQLYKLLVTLLHLGNIQVLEDSQGQLTLKSGSSATLEQIALFLGLEECFFTQAIKERTTTSGRGTLFRISLTLSQARDGLQALIKHIYTQLFNWLVYKINSFLASTDTLDRVDSFIGILDIYGFEVMQRNSLEQLLINYANEILQFQFNKQVFINEQQLYVQEEVSWDLINFSDNRPVIDLLSLKPTGLLALLEEQALLARNTSTDQNLLNLYHQTHLGKHQCYSKPRFESPEFIVQHFAGEVTYCIEGFLSKNNDTLHEDLLDLLSCSTNVFLHAVLQVEVNPQSNRADLGHCNDPQTLPKTPAQDVSAITSPSRGLRSQATENSMSPPPAPHLPTRSGNLPATTPSRQIAGRQDSKNEKKMPRQIANQLSVSYIFRTQLGDLMSQLQCTDPLFVKCIRPNNIKAPNSFNHQLVLEQLRYSGVLEVIRIRREGYSVQIDYNSFLRRFRPISSEHISQETKTPEELRQACKAILERTQDASMFQLGKTKIFMKDTGFTFLRSALYDAIQASCLCIQRMTRGFLVRALRQKKNASATIMQALFRAYMARKVYLHTLGKLKLLQAFAKAQITYGHYKRTRQACVLIQTRIRMWLAKRTLVCLRAKRKAAIKIQSFYRMFSAKKNFSKIRNMLWKELECRAARKIKKFVFAATRNKWLRRQVEVLFKAAESGNLDAVNKVLCLNPQLMLHREQERRFRTLLHAAAFSGETSMVSLLSPSPQDTSALDADGNTPFHEACRGGSEDVVELLLSIGEDFYHKSAFRSRPSIEKKSIAKSISIIRKKGFSSRKLAPGLPLRATGVMSGWLRKKRETDHWHKRWCVLTESTLSYFKTFKDTSPSLIIDLKQALVRRSQRISECFEVHSPLLIAGRNREGRLYFQATTEAELQEWLIPASLICGNKQFYHSLRSAPQTFINMRKRTRTLAFKNDKGESPLHCLFDGKTASSDSASRWSIVKMAGLLVENGSDINSQDLQGETVLHIAVKKQLKSVAMSLLIKGADLRLENAHAQTPLDLESKVSSVSSAESLLKLAESLKICGLESPLLPAPPRFHGFTYLSFLIKELHLPESHPCTSPFLTLTVYNSSQKGMEPPQNIYSAYAHTGNLFLWYSTWHLQSPLQNLPEGSFVLIELKSRSPGSSASSLNFSNKLIAWTVLRMQIESIDTQSESLQMYQPPRDLRLKTFKAADIYLSGEIRLSQDTDVCQASSP